VSSRQCPDFVLGGSSNSSTNRIEASIEACLNLPAKNNTGVANIFECQPDGLGFSLTFTSSSQGSSSDVQNTTSHGHDTSVSVSSGTTTLEEDKFDPTFKSNNPYRALTATRQHSNS